MTISNAVTNHDHHQQDWDPQSGKSTWKSHEEKTIAEQLTGASSGSVC